ncbi:MAG TPA: cation:proton antiporter, partial [Myxococcaceae bacterium]|nr:cation:proton antiporter [Myxococcaceae bacterium]
MADAHEFLRTLVLVLGVAAATAIAFQWIRQPVVLGYLLAGVIIGPHVPLPVYAHEPTVRILSELGVILVMFALGLEFSLRRLLKLGATSGFIAAIECSLMVWLGFLLGRAFGWSTRESLFLGAIVSISSTTVVVKAFGERGIRGRRAETVFGILIAEDLIAVLLLALLTTLSHGGGLSGDSMVVTAARLTAFLVAVLAVGMMTIPRAMRAIVRMERPEITLVTSIALSFALALLAARLGYSVALGAFLAGTLVGESGEEKRIGQLVQPVRDMFAAIFFVSVGMLIDPRVIAAHLPSVAAIAALVVAGKIVGVTLGTFLTGGGSRLSLETGMSLAQIGELSFIIAALGVSTGATGAFLYPIAVAVSAITTLSTPWLIRAADPVAAFVDRKLPRPVQTFAALYGAWVEQLRSAPTHRPKVSRLRRQVRLLFVDAGAVALIIIATATTLPEVEPFLTARLGVSSELAHTAAILVAAVLAGPFCVGMVRSARFIGLALASQALPPVRGGRLDLAAAPRRALVVTLQLAIVLLVGVPLVAVTQPFLPTAILVPVLLAVLAFLGIGFWRSATNLQGHVRAGAQVILEVLSRQGRAADPDGHALEEVKHLLPGLGTPAPLRLHRGDHAVGKTLAQLNLRGLTGASVVALVHGERGVVVPTADEVLREGD